MEKPCAVCGIGFDGHPSAKYCGATCRKRAQRRPGGVKADPVEPVAAEGEGPVTAATLSELNSAKRAGTALGESALALARRIDGAARDSGASLASLAREHRATLAAALADAESAADPLDELRMRRDRKRAGG